MHDIETEISRILSEISAERPHFDDGRINYHEAKRALVLTVVVRSEGRLLLLKRSQKVYTYKGLWSTVAGYFDEPRPAADMARQELQEEIGASPDVIKSLEVFPPFERLDESIGVTWISVPVLVELTQQLEPRLDWEHDEYRWVEADELDHYELVSGMKTTIGRVLNP
jgi:8-oxo-dGTP diphosphatase